MGYHFQVSPEALRRLGDRRPELGIMPEHDARPTVLQFAEQLEDGKRRLGIRNHPR